jgi:hypothetical protein
MLMKIVVILFVIGILLYVVLLVWGAGKGGYKGGNPKHDAENFHADDHSGLELFNGLFGGFSPSLKAASLSPASPANFDLQAKASYTVTVLRDDDHDFRRARFLVLPVPAIRQMRCAHVVYLAFNSTDANESLRQQDSVDADKGEDDRPPDKRKPPNEFTLTILKAGGTLTIARSPLIQPPNTGPCKVLLK